MPPPSQVRRARAARPPPGRGPERVPDPLAPCLDRPGARPARPRTRAPPLRAIAQSSSVAESSVVVPASSRTAASTSGVAIPAPRSPRASRRARRRRTASARRRGPTRAATSTAPGLPAQREPGHRHVHEAADHQRARRRGAAPRRAPRRGRTSGSRSSAVRSAHGTAVARVPTTPTHRPPTSTYTASGPRCTSGAGPSPSRPQLSRHARGRAHRDHPTELSVTGARDTYPPVTPGSHHWARNGCLMSSIGRAVARAAPSERHINVDVQVGRGRSRARGAVAPSQRLPWGKTVGVGAQHVVAMFGATFVFPLVMGLDPNLAIMLSRHLHDPVPADLQRQGAELPRDQSPRSSAASRRSALQRRPATRRTSPARSWSPAWCCSLVGVLVHFARRRDRSTRSCRRP